MIQAFHYRWSPSRHEPGALELRQKLRAMDCELTGQGGIDDLGDGTES
jgi:hypothetical protein